MKVGIFTCIGILLASAATAIAIQPPPSSKDANKIQSADIEMQLWQIESGYQKVAKEKGCWKSDGGELTTTGMPNELAIATPGYAYSFDPFNKDPKQTVETTYDVCGVDKVTGKPVLKEFYCKAGSAACGILLPKTAKECVSTLDFKQLPCPTGMGCQGTGKGAACLPLPGDAAWNGCFTGQTPFLDSDGNGIPDACACPEDMFPTDTNKDGNSDACGTRDDICGLSAQEKAKLGVTVKAKGLEDGGWTLSDYCSTPFEVTSVVCSDLAKTKGVKSTSKKPCTPGQICKLGSCMDTNSDLCDGTNSNKNPKIKGWVTVNGFMQLWDKCGDKCAAFKTDPGAYNTCLQNPGSYPDVVENVVCTSPTDSSTQYFPTPCAKSEYCADGICKSKGGGGDGSGNGNGNGSGSGGDADKKPYDPTKPPTDPGGDNPPPKAGDGGKDKNNNPCTIEGICKEPSDSVHPVENGLLLMGDKYVFGTALGGAQCGSDFVGTPLPAPDVCKWNETELLPILIQFGCMNSKSPPVPSISTCDWSKGEACDWQATNKAYSDLQKISQIDWFLCTLKFGAEGCVLEKTALFAGGGVCKKNLPKPKVNQQAATANTPGKITGTSSFGYKVEHADVCVPAQGKKAVKKWKVVDSPEGAQAYYETCPDQHHCEGGICKPDPCLANKDKIDDKNPCTDDSCKEDTGDIFNLPVAVDDYDNCTADKCVNEGGKAKIVHEPIDTPLCKFIKLCTEKPNDPQCTKPVTDCSKTPNDPKCKTLPPALDCKATPNDPQCKIPVDCAKTPDDPACPKPAKGGFSCDDPKNKNDPQCKTTQDYCYDDDPGNDPSVPGKAVLFPSTPQEKSATDTCIEFDGAQFTAVLQVACGPNTTFFFKKAICPAQTSKGCVNGICIPK